MPVHRDVSEECQRGLASFTLGCDGLFIIAKDKMGVDENDEEREQEMVVLRVRSGDVVQMGGQTRYETTARVPHFLTFRQFSLLSEFSELATRAYFF